MRVRMRRGLELLGVLTVLAVSWYSIAQLRAGSSATAQISIYIPDHPREGAGSARAEALAALPQGDFPGLDHSAAVVRRGRRDTVLHTYTEPL